jgi:hypothetical protein
LAARAHDIDGLVSWAMLRIWHRARERIQTRARSPRSELFSGDIKMIAAETDQPTLREVVRAAFDIARKASELRDVLAKHIKQTAGRDLQVCHRCYSILNDATRAFEHLESSIAESRTLGRYL